MCFFTITGILPCEELISVDIDNNKVAPVSIEEKDRIECYSEDRFMLDKTGLPKYGKFPYINSGGVAHGILCNNLFYWLHG